jgi:hypothetical protein
MEADGPIPQITSDPIGFERFIDVCFGESV